MDWIFVLVMKGYFREGDALELNHNKTKERMIKIAPNVHLLTITTITPHSN